MPKEIKLGTQATESLDPTRNVSGACSLKDEPP